MKDIKWKLEKMGEKIEEKMDDRQAIYDERSEKWQDSEKGEAYQERTDKLEEIRDNISTLQEEVEEYIEEGS